MRFVVSWYKVLGVRKVYLGYLALLQRGSCFLES